MNWGATLAAFSNELEKLSEVDPIALASFLPGAVAGYSTGKSLAGHAGAITAPHGSKIRSEEIAKRVAQVAGPIGMIGGLALAKKHNLGHKMSTFIGRRWPQGLVTDRATEKKLLHGLAPAVAMLGGGAVGGAATGVATGGIARLKHHLTKKKAPKTKTSEVRKKTTQDRIDKAVEEGVPILGGLSVGRTLSDLSFAKQHGASPRRKTIGALIGAAAGFGYNKHKADKKARKKAAKLVKVAEPTDEEVAKTRRLMTLGGAVMGLIGGGGAAKAESLPVLPWALTTAALAAGSANLGSRLGSSVRKKRLAEQKSKTAAPFQFKGTATKRFLSAPGKTIKDLSPKIGRMGVMPV